MRILILTSETPANIWLVNQLLTRHDVVGMVIERRPPAVSAGEKIARRRKMIDRYGMVRTFNKLLFNQLRSRFLADRDAKSVTDNLFQGGAPITYSRDVATIAVSNINAAECIAFISERMPDLIAVCGTGVLKPEVFTLAPLGAINIHTGITPEYRSADPIFWALYQGEPEKVGVTVHYVDSGIDTGPIIYQESVPVCADDTLATLYVKCIRKGAELYSRTLGDIAAGTVRTLDRSGVKGRKFLSVDLGLAQYLLFRWRFRRMASRLPRRNVAAAAEAVEVRR